MHPKQHTKRRSPRERGAALIVVMAILLVLTLMGMGSLNTSTQQFTLSSYQTYAYQASQLAKAGVHRIAREFKRQDMNLLWPLLCKKPAATVADSCDEAQSLCFSANSLFPLKNAASKVDHGGMRWNSLAGTRGKKGIPSVWGDYRIRIHNPRLATHGRPISGNDVKRTCTYIVTVTATGRVYNANVDVKTGQKNSSRRDLSARTFRAYLQVIGRGDTCNGCPS